MTDLREPLLAYAESSSEANIHNTASERAGRDPNAFDSLD
jgi:hypothetical protein